jgi:putative DNA primase/helicase
MNELINFARAHGLILNSLPPIGVWVRVSTTDKPMKKNGAIKWMGDHAFIQNWAVDQEVIVWHGQAPKGLDPEKIARLAKQADDKRAALQRQAAAKAAGLLNNCQRAMHDYLRAKGFPDEPGNVYVKDGVPYLIIPMRVGNQLVGAQVISPEGDKKFLYGQRTKGAEYVFDNKGPHYLCEGYATALSIRAAMKALRMRYTIHVCFSAQNLLHISKQYDDCFIIADNDASTTGQRMAEQSGKRWWMPPTTGFDFNDFHQEVGLFKASQALQKALRVSSVSKET